MASFIENFQFGSRLRVCNFPQGKRIKKFKGYICPPESLHCKCEDSRGWSSFKSSKTTGLVWCEVTIIQTPLGRFRLIQWQIKVQRSRLIGSVWHEGQEDSNDQRLLAVVEVTVEKS